MSKSVLYAVNTAAQTIPATGAIINFGSAVRRYGCNLNASGGNVEISGCGYYDIDANVTFTAAAAGAAVIQLFMDGVAVTGAKATITIGAANEAQTVNIPALARMTCDCTSTLTAVISGLAGTVTNAAIVAERE
jgi:hypothetical protein